MRIVFIGASGFGLRAAQVLASLTECQLVGVVTAPRQFSISYRPAGVTNVLHADLGEFAAAHDVPCHLLTKGMNHPELFEKVSSWRPDCFIVVGWYHMVPAKWRQLAPAYGLHGSLLPDYSGGAPLVWAMINGERRTGITLFQFDDGVDSGPIVGRLATDIALEDTIATLYARIEELGLELLKENVPLLARGTARFLVQDESKRRMVPQRSPEDGAINWNQDARRVHDFIRAQTRPYPGAFSKFRSSKVSVWRSTPHENMALELRPGELGLHEGLLLVGCGYQSVLELNELGENGNDTSAAIWARVKSIRAGEAFHV